MKQTRVLFSFLAGTVVIGLLLTACGKEEPNAAPEMDSISGPDLVVAGETATFVGSGSDDDGDALTYTFSADGGTFSGGTYTAPSTDGTYTITCIANDGTEDSDPLTAEVVVATVPSYAHQWAYNGDGADVGFEDVEIPATATFDAGKVNQAIVFDSTPLDSTDAAFGTDTPSLAGADDFSFSLWFATSDETEMGFLFGKTFDGMYIPDPVTGNPDNGSSKGLILYVSETDTIDLAYDNSWIGATGAATTATNDGSWHHIVVTHVGNTAATNPDVYTIYMDGEALVSEVIGETNPDLAGVITMGNGLESTAYGEWPGAYQGYMDEVVYWDVVLTAAQVAALYDAHD